MIALQAITGSLLLAAAHARGHVLALASRHPRVPQTLALRRLLFRARNTAFGREHGFAGIRTVEQFRERVPLRSYSELTPWLARARNEADVIWPGRVPYFAMSSGTTGGNKYLPITHETIRQQQRGGFDPVASYLRASGDRALLAGKSILITSTTSLDRDPSGTWVGDNTGIMAQHLPSLLAQLQLPSAPVRALRSWDARLGALASEAMAQDVRLIAGTPAWFPALFDAVLQRARTRGSDARTVLELWPNLRLLTVGGVRFEPYRGLIEQRLGGRVPYLDVYNATEGGIMAVQDRLDDPAMLVLPDTGVYYEFVPLDDVGSTQPRRLSLWQVERGQCYALAVSTASGLFSYLLGDCLRFVSTEPHRVLFEGRTAAFLNVCGEHVSQGELERAVTDACSAERVALVDFTVVPEVGVGAGGSAMQHVFMLECEGAAHLLAARLAQRIDARIAAGNEDYAVHRDSAYGLLAPEVRLVPRGTFMAFMRKRGQLGGQHKPPRVLNESAASTFRELAGAG